VTDVALVALACGAIVGLGAIGARRSSVTQTRDVEIAPRETTMA
jgi:hypothetical protein